MARKKTENLDEQGIYEAVRKWFTRKNARLAYDDEKVVCVYRLNDNPKSLTRCAVGCLLPNDAYMPESEGQSASAVYAELFPLVPTHFLDKLQQVHDRQASRANGSVAGFVKDLDRFAEAEGLQVVK